MKRATWISVYLLLAALVPIPAAGASREDAPANDDAALTAFDYAFRFASTIIHDPKDMGRAQEVVVRDFIEAGDLQAALDRVGSVEGWRRGVNYAELAEQMALLGEPEEAYRLLDEAWAVRRRQLDWQGPRIEAYIARALARLGEFGTTAELAEKLAVNDKDYSGRATATVALAQATVGEFDAAMSRLEALGEFGDIYVTWYRTDAYLELGRLESLSPERRRRALDAALEAARTVANWKQIDLLKTVALEYEEQGESRLARQTMEEAERQIEAMMPDPTPLWITVKTLVARGWAELGRPKRGLSLLQGTEALVERSMVIEQPAIYADLATAYAACGDEATGLRLLNQALDSADSLDNPRPRALAMVMICRSLGKNGLAIDTNLRSRLDASYRALAGAS